MNIEQWWNSNRVGNAKARTAREDKMSEANKTSRRNLLAIMGMSASAALVNTEALAEDIGPRGTPNIHQRGLDLQLRVATALEGLAKGIRTGEIAAIGLDTSSRLDVNEWLRHDICITIEMLGPQDKTS